MSNLEKLNLRSNSIQYQGLLGFHHLNKLDRLDLSENDIGDNGAHLLSGNKEPVNIPGTIFENFNLNIGADYDPSMENLRNLILHNCNITNKGVSKLCEIEGLKNLVLANNNIGPEGAVEIGKTLISLESLSLAHTRIGDEGITGLINLKKLHTLYLDGTGLTDKWPHDLFVSIDNQNYINYRRLCEIQNETKIELLQLFDNNLLNSNTVIPVSQFQFLTSHKLKSIKRVFISYSKKDLEFVHRFIEALAPLKDSGLIEDPWYCTSLRAGSDWNDEIQKHLEAADIIFLYVLYRLLKLSISRIRK